MAFDGHHEFDVTLTWIWNCNTRNECYIPEIYYSFYLF